MLNRKFTTYLTISVAVLAIIITLVSSLGVQAATTTKSALIYGDSITYESKWEIYAQMSLKKGWTSYVHSYGGTAPCDWLPWLNVDLWAYNPNIVAMETFGNNGTECMKDANGVTIPIGSQAYYDKYTADLTTLVSTITGQGRKVLFIQAPPAADTTRNAIVTQLNVIEKQIAGQYHGVSVSAVPRNTVSNSGKYVEYKPCLTTETVDMGCSGGKIAIRTISNLDKGIHLCPIGLYGANPPGICSIYSSGEFRFGKSVANTVVSPPAPLLP